MRLVRLGAETSRVGADVRAALASWGTGDPVLGGIALLGVTVAGFERQVDAVVVLPRGVLVVVGVDLPDPAMRLDAPLGKTWLADGWPLVRPDGAVNPAEEALAASAAVGQLLQQGRVEPLPVGTIVAVGPYVGQVMQPTVDLHRGVRVLYPQPKSLLAAARELAVYERSCSAVQARALLTALVGDQVNPTEAELTGEGFREAGGTDPRGDARDMGTARTTVLPKVTGTARPAASQLPQVAGPKRTRWLPIGAVALLAVLLITGITVAIASSGSGSPAASPLTPGATPQSAAADVTVNGVRFSPRGSGRDPDCAGHAYGDVRVWLGQHHCVGLARALYQATVPGGQHAAAATAVLAFPDAPTAKAFAVEAQTAGSGGVNDLVKDGRGWPGGPTSFDNAAYTVAAAGTSVRLVEVVWIGQPSSPTDTNLTRLAADAASLPSAP